ncbi:hypothetical protein GCM10010469_41800 [Streptomyces labedae]|uniref:Uncharacterized protein n=1 Tax=Streptomyces labedae TaxID=285569 RepID=A0ABP6R324_9ACTN
MGVVPRPVPSLRAYGVCVSLGVRASTVRRYGSRGGGRRADAAPYAPTQVARCPACLCGVTAAADGMSAQPEAEACEPSAEGNAVPVPVSATVSRKDSPCSGPVRPAAPPGYAEARSAPSP